MPPYLRTVTSFADVPVTDTGVDTVKFLEASNGLVGLFDLLGSAAFLPVTRDLRGNITKVQTRYDATELLSGTLESLVENEKSEKKRVATEGLMWLIRGLKFTCKALQNSQENASQELKASFVQSYEITLKAYHGILIRPIFNFAMAACPYRADFYQKLAADPDGGSSASNEEVNEELTRWLNALDKIILRMDLFYKDGQHDKGF